MNCDICGDEMNKKIEVKININGFHEKQTVERRNIGRVKTDEKGDMVVAECRRCHDADRTGRDFTVGGGYKKVEVYGNGPDA